MRSNTLSRIATVLTALLIVPALAAPAFSQTWLATWNQATTGQAGMSPYAVALDRSGHVYVSEFNHYVTHEFTTGGVPVDTLGWTNNNWDFSMVSPRGVGIDSHGNVYVADSGNHRIRIFTSIGAHLADWPITTPTGAEGSPDGIAVGQGDTVYVVVSGANVDLFTPDGMMVRRWGSAGSGDGQFSSARGIAIDQAGFVYVSDGEQNQIQKFDRFGVFVGKWGSFGSADGRFSTPIGLAVDPQGHILVADYYNDRIQVFDSTGAFVSKWGSNGRADGQFRFPTGVAVEPDGIVYVADWGNSRVQKFGPAVAGVEPSGPRAGVELAEPSPNPSMGRVQLSFALAHQSRASLAIYDMQGRRVAAWEWPTLAAGPHAVSWNGRGPDGTAIPPGVLFARLTADGATSTQRLVRLE